MKVILMQLCLEISLWWLHEADASGKQNAPTWTSSAFNSGLPMEKNFFLAFVVTTGRSIISVEIAVGDITGFE